MHQLSSCYTYTGLAVILLLARCASPSYASTATETVSETTSGSETSSETPSATETESSSASSTETSWPTSSEIPSGIISPTGTPASLSALPATRSQAASHSHAAPVGPQGHVIVTITIDVFVNASLPNASTVLSLAQPAVAGGVAPLSAGINTTAACLIRDFFACVHWNVTAGAATPVLLAGVQLLNVTDQGSNLTYSPGLAHPANLASCGGARASASASASDSPRHDFNDGVPVSSAAPFIWRNFPSAPGTVVRVSVKATAAAAATANLTALALAVESSLLASAATVAGSINRTQTLWVHLQASSSDSGSATGGGVSFGAAHLHSVSLQAAPSTAPSPRATHEASVAPPSYRGEFGDSAATVGAFSALGVLLCIVVSALSVMCYRIQARNRSRASASKGEGNGDDAPAAMCTEGDVAVKNPLTTPQAQLALLAQQRISRFPLTAPQQQQQHGAPSMEMSAVSAALARRRAVSCEAHTTPSSRNQRQQQLPALTEADAAFIPISVLASADAAGGAVQWGAPAS